MKRAPEMTGPLDDLVTQGPLLEPNDLRDQAEYYDIAAQDHGLDFNPEGRRRFKRAALALRVTALLVGKYDIKKVMADLDKHEPKYGTPFNARWVATP